MSEAGGDVVDESSQELAAEIVSKSLNDRECLTQIKALFTENLSEDCPPFKKHVDHQPDTTRQLLSLLNSALSGGLEFTKSKEFLALVHKSLGMDRKMIGKVGKCLASAMKPANSQTELPPKVSTHLNIVLGRIFDEIRKAKVDKNATVEPADLNVVDGEIKTASFARLVESLTSFNVIEVDDVLLTYRAFATSSELLTALIERYNKPLPKDASKDNDKKALIQIKVLTILKRWTKVYWADFVSTTETQRRCIDFLTEVEKSKSKYSGVATSVLAQIDKNNSDPNLKQLGVQFEPIVALTKPLRNDLTAIFNAYTFDDIAIQISHIDWMIFRKIGLKEFEDTAWLRADAAKRSPHLTAMSNRFNELGDWVRTAILTTERPKSRLTIIRHFLDLADSLWKIKNYNGVMVIISALESGPISRLKMTMEAIEKDKRNEHHGEILKDLRELTASKKNWMNLREAIKADLSIKDDGSVNQYPVIPYMGLFLSDLIFVNEGNPSTLDGLINVSKAVMNAKILRLIIEIQQQAYKDQIPLNKDLQKLLHNFKVLSEDDMYVVSRWIEPKEGTEQPPRPDFIGSFAQYFPPRTDINSRSPDLTGSSQRKHSKRFNRTKSMTFDKKPRFDDFATSMVSGNAVSLINPEHHTKMMKETSFLISKEALATLTASETVRTSAFVKMLEKDEKTWTKVKITLGQKRILVFEEEELKVLQDYENIAMMFLPQVGKVKIFSIAFNKSEPIFFQTKEENELVIWETHFRLLLPVDKVTVTPASSMNEMIYHCRKIIQKKTLETAVAAPEVKSNAPRQNKTVGSTLRAITGDQKLLEAVSKDFFKRLKEIDPDAAAWYTSTSFAKDTSLAKTIESLITISDLGIKTIQADHLLVEGYLGHGIELVCWMRLSAFNASLGAAIFDKMSTKEYKDKLYFGLSEWTDFTNRLTLEMVKASEGHRVYTIDAAVYSPEIDVFRNGKANIGRRSIWATLNRDSEVQGFDTADLVAIAAPLKDSSIAFELQFKDNWALTLRVKTNPELQVIVKKLNEMFPETTFLFDDGASDGAAPKSGALSARGDAVKAAKSDSNFKKSNTGSIGRKAGKSAQRTNRRSMSSLIDIKKEFAKEGENSDVSLRTSEREKEKSATGASGVPAITPRWVRSNFGKTSIAVKTICNIYLSDLDHLDKFAWKFFETIADEKGQLHEIFDAAIQGSDSKKAMIVTSLFETFRAVAEDGLVYLEESPIFAERRDRYSKMGITAATYTQLNSALLRAIRDDLVDEFTPSHDTEWTSFLESVSTSMQRTEPLTARIGTKRSARDLNPNPPASPGETRQRLSGHSRSKSETMDTLPSPNLKASIDSTESNDSMSTSSPPVPRSASPAPGSDTSPNVPRAASSPMKGSSGANLPLQKHAPKSTIVRRRAVSIPDEDEIEIANNNKEPSPKSDGVKLDK